MKRVVIAIIMLLLAISVSTTSAYWFDKKITELGNSVERLSDQPDKEKINAVLSDWNSTKVFLKFVTVHEIVNEIDIHFSSLKISDDIASTKEICSEIEILLKILDNSEKALTENIF